MVNYGVVLARKSIQSIGFDGDFEPTCVQLFRSFPIVDALLNWDGNVKNKKNY